MTQVARDDPGWSSFNAMLMARTLAGRWSEPEECAGAAVFLASASADFITGVTLPVDGGYSIF
jgi:Dehydrogenases with different specificities (related to short-chain alcohol dehydrogenases)